MCRQALHEFGPDMVVLMADGNGSIREARLSGLLPEAFGPDSLGNR
jgi:cytidine deaminase